MRMSVVARQYPVVRAVLLLAVWEGCVSVSAADANGAVHPRRHTNAMFTLPRNDSRRKTQTTTRAVGHIPKLSPDHPDEDDDYSNPYMPGKGTSGGKGSSAGKGTIPGFSPDYDDYIPGKGEGGAPDDYHDDYISKGKGKGGSGDDDDDNDGKGKGSRGKGGGFDDDYVSKGKGKGGSDSKSTKSTKGSKSSKDDKKSKKDKKDANPRPSRPTSNPKPHPKPTPLPAPPTNRPHTSPSGDQNPKPHPKPTPLPAPPTNRPHTSPSGDQISRPPIPIPPTREPSQPTGPTRAPSPSSGQTTSVVLPLYAVDYTLSDNTMPSRDEYIELESVTSDYFEEFMLRAYQVSTQATLARFETTLETSIFRFGEPVQVQYESIAYFSEDSIILPQPRFLYSVLQQSLDDDGDYIVALESELPSSNVFTSTTRTVFTKPEDPPEGRTSDTAEETKTVSTSGSRTDSSTSIPIPAIAGALAGVTVLLAAFTLYRGKRSGGKKSSDEVAKKLNDHSSGATGGATVSGETYETYGGETHDEEEESSLSQGSEETPVGDEERGGRASTSVHSHSSMAQSDLSSFWERITLTPSSRQKAPTLSRQTLDAYDANLQPQNDNYRDECIEEFKDGSCSSSHSSNRNSQQRALAPPPDDVASYPLWKRLEDVERLKHGARKHKTVAEVEEILSREMQNGSPF